MAVWSYTVNTIYTNMPNYFSGRSIPQSSCWEHTAKVCLELSQNYPFSGLEVTGPTITLTQYKAGPYTYSTFQQPADAGLELNKFDSFFAYYQGGPPVVDQANAGYPLKFRSIDDLEILMNQLGPPTYWSRHDGNIYFAMQPDQANFYYVYLRYQKEHPFPNRGTASAGSDPILLGNTWQDIVEVCVAERLARFDFNLNKRATDFYESVYGDPKFQRTGGTEGAPGLIFSRTSHTQRDQTTSTRQMRLRMRQPQ